MLVTSVISLLAWRDKISFLPLNQMVKGGVVLRPYVFFAVEHPRCLFGVKNSDTRPLVCYDNPLADARMLFSSDFGI